MRNVCHGTCVQLRKHSNRLLAHWYKEIADLAEATAAKRLEPVPEGAHMEAVKIGVVCLVQRQQLGQIPCVAQIRSELSWIEGSRAWP
tara:strand:- start:64 stop:327 length:264 start_codon:yes stop_codon:yes gene_type:complete